MAVVLASVAFWAPVVLALPGDDGKPETVDFRARYKRLKKSERVELDACLMASRVHHEAGLRGQEVPAGLAEPITDREVLQMVLVDWDLKDKQGQAVPYTSQMLDELGEDWDGFEAALVVGYFAARQRQADPEARAKN